MGEEVFFDKKFLGNEKFNENNISFQKDILCKVNSIIFSFSFSTQNSHFFFSHTAAATLSHTPSVPCPPSQLTTHSFLLSLPHFPSLFLSHSHKVATHNVCALVRAMATNVRLAKTNDEWSLLIAANQVDDKTLTSLLRKGVYPNVCWVCDMNEHERILEKRGKGG